MCGYRRLVKKHSYTSNIWISQAVCILGIQCAVHYIHNCDLCSTGKVHATNVDEGLTCPWLSWKDKIYSGISSTYSSIYCRSCGVAWLFHWITSTIEKTGTENNLPVLLHWMLQSYCIFCVYMILFRENVPLNTRLFMRVLAIFTLQYWQRLLIGWWGVGGGGVWITQ
jgi:hypothetical protein